MAAATKSLPPQYGFCMSLCMSRCYGFVAPCVGQVVHQSAVLSAKGVAADYVGIQKGSLRLRELVVQYTDSEPPLLPLEVKQNGVPHWEFAGPNAKAIDGHPLNDDDIRIRKEVLVLEGQIAAGKRYLVGMRGEYDELRREYKVRVYVVMGVVGRAERACGLSQMSYCTLPIESTFGVRGFNLISY